MATSRLSTRRVEWRVQVGTANKPAQGLVIFEASVSYIPDPLAAGGPRTAIPEPVAAVLDAGGYACTPDPSNPAKAGERGVELFTTDSLGEDGGDWTWTARPQLRSVNGIQMADSVPAFSFTVPSGTGTWDLAEVQKVPASPGLGTDQAVALVKLIRGVAGEAKEVALGVKARADAGEFRGPQGIPGLNAVPASDAIAQYLGTTGNPVQVALQARQPFVRAEDYPSFQAALDAGAASKRDVVFSSTFVLTTGVIWQANVHSIRGQGDARLDCRGMTSGAAITVIGLGSRNYLDWEFLGQIHSASGFQLRGPDSDNTSVDGIVIDSQASKSSHINFERLYVRGFRDGIIFGANNWCVSFIQCLIANQKRRGLSFLATPNAGENYNFHGCTIANVKNTAGTGAGIYMDLNAQFLGVNLFGCSLDYCDYLADVNAGTLSLNGCHLEDNTNSPMFTLSYTGGKARTALTIVGSVFDPAEARPGRSHLIEVKSESSSNVHVTLLGDTFRVFDRPVQVFRNLSTGTPTLTHSGGALDNSPGTNIASFGHYTNQLVAGDMLGELMFLPTAFEEGGWYRQGTVAYSFAPTTSHGGATKQALKMVGSGILGTTATGQTIRVMPGRVIAITAFVKPQTIVAGKVEARIQWKRADKTQVGKTAVIATFTTSGDWQGIGRQAMVPAGAVYADIVFVNSDLDGTVWVDDVVLTVL